MHRLFGLASGTKPRSNGVPKASFDLFILAAAGLGALLFQPLMAKGLPQAPDALLHFYRSVVWSDAWQQAGVWWPRWHTVLYQGYGYPIFNFYGPLLYAGTSILQRILPDIETAFKGMLLLVCLAYPVGMYLWARDLLGRWSAILAATAYTFATYRFYELYFLGNYAQFLAWSLYPWILFFFGRLALTRGRGHFLGAVSTLTALLLTHNISSLLFLPVLVAWVAVLAFRHRERKPVAVLVAAAVCGLGVAAVFVLPALGETGATRVHVLTQGVYDVAANFLQPADLVAPIRPLDDRAARPPLPFTFGRLHLFLAAVGALTLVNSRVQRAKRAIVAFALAGVLISAFLMLSPSLPIWQTVPMLRFIESPRRLYGIGFLFSSVLCGAALLWFDHLRRARTAIAGVLVCGLIVAVGVYQFPRSFISLPGTLSAYLGYETAFRALGTTAGGEYLPPWVDSVPVQPALHGDFSRVALLNPIAGQSGIVLEAGPERLRIHVTQASASEVVVAQFYFPGWQAKVDGVPVPVQPAAGSGCISLALPAGDHEILLEFGPTPIRRAATAVSLLALLAALAIALRLPPSGTWRNPALDVGSRAEAGILLLIGILLVLKVALVGPLVTLFRFASPPDTVQGAQHHTDLTIADKVGLLGYDLDRSEVEQGQKLHVRLYWQVLEPLDRDYASYLQLLTGPEHRVYAQSDHAHPGNMPTSTWLTSQYVIDDHTILVAPETPPVAYRMEAGLYAERAGERLGSVQLPELVYVSETRPLRAAEIPDLSPTHFGAAIQLLGHRTTAEPNAVTITLYWQAAERPPADYQVFIHGISAADGQVLIQADSAPLAGLYPTSLWRPGQIIADAHRIELSASGRANIGAFQIGLYDLTNGERVAANHADGSRWQNDAVTLPIALR